MKMLFALVLVFSATGAMAYCENTYDVTRDADELGRNATDLVYEARRYGQQDVSFRASMLSSAARRLEMASRGNFSSCGQIRSDFMDVQMAYRDIQHAYQRSGGDRELGYGFRRLAQSFRDLSYSINRIREARRYEPPRPFPPRRPYPPRRPFPPRRPGRY